MLDLLPLDLLLKVINNLDELDKYRLSIINKDILNVFNDYKNSLICYTIIDLTDDDLFDNYHKNDNIINNHIMNVDNMLNNCINKFPNCKIHLSSNYNTLLEKYKNNINSIEYYYKNIYIYDVINEYQNIEHLNFNECSLKFNKCNILLLNKIKSLIINNSCYIDDISMIININFIEMNDIHNIDILPNNFNSEYLTFNNCNFINNTNIYILNNSNNVIINKCKNITNISLLNKLSIKHLYYY